MERTMKRRTAAAAAALALVTGGAVLAGCGSDSAPADTTGTAAATSTTGTATAAASNGVENLTADEIVSASRKAADSASSVTVKGSIAQNGQNVSVDLQVGKDAAQGTISTQGVEIEIKAVDGKAYFKLSGEAFAKIAGQGDNPELAKAVSSLLGDKWLLVPANADSGSLDGFNKLAQKDSLIGGLLNSDNVDTLMVKGPGDVNGTPVVFLEDDKKSGTLAIQTVGEPYPVQIKGEGDSGGTGQLDFTDWDAPVNVTAPTDVLDIGALTDLGSSGSGSTTSSN